MSVKFSPDNTWTLFLDRDGVINERFMDHYVLQPEDFTFLPQVPESIARFTEIFGRLLVVTNQQGIGKGLMTDTDLTSIHAAMLQEIEKAGGKIHKVYHCPALKESRHFWRKPNPGMALAARKDFPEIRFRKSVMVGDTLSDMQFGKKLGMKTVFIGTDRNLIARNDKLIDYCFASLAGFATFLTS